MRNASADDGSSVPLLPRRIFWYPSNASQIISLKYEGKISMRVYLLKDIENVGMAGTMVNVTDGYASNYLFPHKLAVKVEKAQEEFFKNKVVKAEKVKEVISSKLGMLAERIKTMHLTIKKRVHDDGKLYGSVSADELVDLLKAKDVVANRKQIVFGKSIKATGEHSVGVKLTAKLIPEFTLKVVGEAA